jgi:stage II sporulation protein D
MTKRERSIRVARVLNVLKVLVLEVQRVLRGRGLKVLPLAASLVASACAPGPGRIGLPGSLTRVPSASLRVQVREGTALVIRNVPIEQYVVGAALSEVHPNPGEDALAERVYEVQSVIARSYAVANRGRHAKDGFDLCSTTHCQVYEPARLKTSRWAAVAISAATRTEGEVLWFADAPARAVFHADCGGHTSAAAAVWGGVAPAYLAGRRDSVETSAAHSSWTYEVGVDALRTALNSDVRTAVGAKLDRIEIAGRDGAGRAEQIVLRGTQTFVVRGEVFREIVTRRLGARTLRSTLFSVTKSGRGFTFSGKGFGHGVGLCQAGAIARLRAGSSPKDVLSFYFPGTSLH